MTDIADREFNVRQEELDLERARLLVSFAKFRFGSTLIGGLVLVLGLATLSAFSSFKIDTGLLGTLLIVLVVVLLVVGFLPSWELPRIIARIRDTERGVPAKGEKGAANPPDKCPK